MPIRERRRVVLVHSSDEFYGADRMVLHVINVLTAMGLEVEVWLPTDLPHSRFPLCRRLDELGVAWKHERLPILRRARLRPRGLIALVGDWIATVRRLRADRPHAIYLASSACLLCAPAARVAGVRRQVLHLQERWSGLEGRVLRLLARPTTTRIAISENVARSADLKRPRSVVVANCVEDAADRVVHAHHVRKPSDDVVFVVASRWNRWKGHATLLRAWDAANCPGQLVVLGGPPGTGDGVDVHQLVTDLVRRPETIDIVGEVADVTPYLGQADVVLVPSDQPEPFGLVVIEGFSLGRPVIASRAGGPEEIVVDGETGWLYEIGDSDELARILRDVRRIDVERAGHRARAAYERSFTPQRFNADLKSVLGRALQLDTQPLLPPCERDADAADDGLA